ncbi:MAG: tRNA (adenosine(37)-N6)-dimethylallyltransferase MiaA [Bacillota bacterium]|nr:tRNA (adenosine(37)-N6)-dimethylallyltransferase MiaA [Bacillota bacterium]
MVSGECKPKLIAIVGPTAVGKTAAAIELAMEIQGEVLSCDSMQVYKGMNVGTAKASPEEQLCVPHHLIDLVEPDQLFSVADYQALAQQVIVDVNQRNKMPILTGGTGLYYQSVVDNYNFFPMEAQRETRAKLEEQCKEYGLASLYNALQKIDPNYAEMISENDKKRIIRAHEVFELTGQPFSQFQGKNPNTYQLVIIGLFLEREFLYERIDKRVDEMLENGLLDEVKELKQNGYDLSLNALNALGYKQGWCYLDGLMSYEDMVQEIKQETRRYAKRQYTWFNKDKRIQWIDVRQILNTKDLHKKICSLVEGQFYKV